MSRYNDEHGTTVQATGDVRRSYQCGLCGAKGGSVKHHGCPYAYPGDLRVADIWHWRHGGVIPPKREHTKEDEGPAQYMSCEDLRANINGAKAHLQQLRMAIDDMRELLPDDQREGLG